MHVRVDGAKPPKGAPAEADAARAGTSGSSSCSTRRGPGPARPPVAAAVAAGAFDRRRPKCASPEMGGLAAVAGGPRGVGECRRVREIILRITGEKGLGGTAGIVNYIPAAAERSVSYVSNKCMSINFTKQIACLC